MDLNIYFEEAPFINICSNNQDFFFSEIASALVVHAKSNFLFSKELIRSNDIVAAFFNKYITNWPEINRTFIEILPLDKDTCGTDILPKECIGSAFLLEGIEPYSLKESTGIMFGCDYDTKDVFKDFFLQANDKNFEKLFTVGQDFMNWKDLEIYNMPFTDLVVVDPFLFNLSDKELGRNFYGFIKSILKTRKNTINLVVYTLKDQLNGRTEKEVCDFLSHYIEQLTEYKPNVTLITIGGYDKDLVKELKEHDRVIVTNYYMIVPGNSMTFFEENGNIRPNTRYLSIKSLLKKENRSYLDGLLVDIQKYINKSFTHNTIKVQGDKISNFLTF